MNRDYAAHKDKWRTQPKPMTATEAAMLGFEVAVFSILLILAWCGA